MPTNSDLTSLITKLNNNVNGMVINGQLNIMDNFKFREDFTLTNKEFCCLCNLVQNYVYADNTISFEQLDVTVLSSNINKYQLDIYIELDKSTFNKEMKLNLKNNIIVAMKNFRNKNNISSETQIVSINGIEYSNLSDNLKDFIKDLANFNIFEDIFDDIKNNFNCYFEFIENGVNFYA